MVSDVEFGLNEDGEHIDIWHDCTKHRAYAMLPIGAEHWVVAAKEPLTVTPSILCRDCGLHGFITNGVWCPC